MEDGCVFRRSCAKNSQGCRMIHTTCLFLQRHLPVCSVCSELRCHRPSWLLSSHCLWLGDASVHIPALRLWCPDVHTAPCSTLASAARTHSAHTQRTHTQHTHTALLVTFLFAQFLMTITLLVFRLAFQSMHFDEPWDQTDTNTHTPKQCP